MGPFLDSSLISDMPADVSDAVKVVEDHGELYRMSSI